MKLPDAHFPTDPQDLPDRRPGLLRSAGAAALLFCLSTFAISAFRASLNPDEVFDLYHPKRIVLIAAGALVFWLAIRGRAGARPGLPMLRRMALVGLPGLAVLFVLAMAFDIWVMHETANLAARNLRWILLWSGYFGTGLAAWLALSYGTALAEAEQQAVDRLAIGEAQDEALDQGFWVKTGRQTLHIAQGDVEWIEAEGNYVRIHATNGANGLVRSTLAAIESQLEADQFMRIHRSALCRRSAIRGYRRKPSGALLALLASGAEAPMGRRFARELTGQMRSLVGDESDLDDTVSRRTANAQAA